MPTIGQHVSSQLVLLFPLFVFALCRISAETVAIGLSHVCHIVSDLIVFLLCQAIMPKEDPCLCANATVWAKASIAMNKANPHQQCGGLASKNWLPGIVNHGFMHKSAKRKDVKCIDAMF